SVTQGTDTRNLVFYRDLTAGDEFVELISAFEAGYHFAGNEGSLLFFRTDLAAARGRLIAIDIGQPERAAWRTIILEREAVLEGAMRAGGQIVAIYLEHAHHRLERFALTGESLGEIRLPAPGGLMGISGSRDEDELFFGFNSFVIPPPVYRYVLSTGDFEELSRAEVDFDPTPFVTRQVFATSKDGTRVPI